MTPLLSHHHSFQETSDSGFLPLLPAQARSMSDQAAPSAGHFFPPYDIRLPFFRKIVGNQVKAEQSQLRFVQDQAGSHGL